MQPLSDEQTPKPLKPQIPKRVSNIKIGQWWGLSFYQVAGLGWIMAVVFSSLSVGLTYWLVGPSGFEKLSIWQVWCVCFYLMIFKEFCAFEQQFFRWLTLLMLGYVWLLGLMSLIQWATN